MDNQPQVAIRAAVLARRPLALQADALAVADASRDFYVQRLGVSLSTMPKMLYTGSL
ncbi:Uncharacterised protein [Raoultella terrigena]|uniref:Uncharacterized protein n=1 Tax=Raoultella terrigena TaxID=577 RepID=A0A4U9D7A2_RAOTE|nr:Uncharacterised protein [Raoultella terrigena]